MKHIKKLLVLFLVINVFNSCDKEETSYALEDISAPINIKAIFNISQDDTGTVTVTPTAEGASTFEVYFGDVEGETPEKVSPGETATHVYAEGEFNLRVVAIGMTGLKSELVRVVTISFSAPEDLIADIAISDSNPFEVSVTPSATNATVYDVYFGDVEDEEPTTIMDGEAAVHIYAETGDYTIRIVARGAGAATVEISEVVTISGVSPCTAETEENIDPANGDINWTFKTNDVAHTFDAFGNISGAIANNPITDGINASCFVQKVVKTEGCETWSGLGKELGTALDFTAATTNKIFTMKVLAETQITEVTLRLERLPFPDTDPAIEAVASITEVGVWQELTFDFSAINTGTYKSMIIYFERNQGCDGDVYYFDDIKQVGATAAAKPEMPINFEATNLDYTWNGFGSSDFGPIPAGVIANPDASGANTSANVVQIEKLSGAQVWAGASLDLAGPVNFDNGTTVKVKVWSPRIGTPILFKMEDSTSPPDGNGNPTIVVEVIVNSTVAMAWEELTFDLTTFGAFSTTNSYDRVILFPDFNNGGQGETFYFDDIVQSNGSGGGSTGAKPQLPIGFQSTTIDYTINGFGASDFGPIPAAVIDNPDASGINTTTKVLEIEKLSGAQVWAGASIPLAGAIDFSAGTTVKIKVWSPRIGTPIRFKIEDSSSAKDGNGNPVTFAEVEVNSTVAMAWEELSFDMTNPVAGSFNTSISFDTAIVFPDFGSAGQGETFYFDDIAVATGGSGGGTSSGKVSFPVNFETPETGAGANWIVFEDDTAPLEIVSNPNASGINTSNTVAKLTATPTNAPYAGTITSLETPFVLSTSNSVVKMMVYKDKIGQVGLKLAKGEGTVDEIKVTNTKINEWEELTFDFTGRIGFPEADGIDALVVFPDFENRTSTSVTYFDNITLNASTGGSGGGGGTSSSAPTSAAPSPTEAQADVINMYSNAYTQDVNVSSWRSDWSTSTLTDIQVAGNDTKEYIDADFVGVEFYDANAVDASGMAFFHVDVWTPNATTFRIKLVDLGTGSPIEAEIAFEGIAQGQWVSLDIPMADFIAGGMSATNSIQQLIFSGLPTGTFDFYIDNVYFHN